MNDDFNTAGALGAFFGFITEANSYLDAADGAVNAEVVVTAAEFIERSMDVLGIELPEQEAELPVEIIALAAERAGYAGDDTAEAAEALLLLVLKRAPRKIGPWPMPFVMLWASSAWWWKTPPPALASRRNNQGLGRFVAFAPAVRPCL